MTVLTTLPANKEVKDLFAGLLGRELTVEPGMPPSVDQLTRAVIAVYVDDHRQLSGVAGLSLALAAYSGASMGLIPKGGADACIEDEALSTAVGENVAEICNIMAQLLNNEGAPHLKLDKAFLPGDAAPNDVQARLIALGNRIDLDIAIAGYGSGTVWISLAS
jgi:hypothetical protein